MTDDDGDNYESLPEDIGGNIDPLDEHDRLIEEDYAEFHAPGENLNVEVLGGFLFKQRAVDKINGHGLAINDASFALRNGRHDRSKSSGRDIVIGQSDKGAVLVVYEACIGKEDLEIAHHFVITAFPI